MHWLLCMPPLGEGSTLNLDPAESCKCYDLTWCRRVAHKITGATDKHINTM